MLTEQRSTCTELIHVYYFIFNALWIACHYKTYIIPTLFLLLMSSATCVNSCEYLNLLNFMLDNTIMLTVCVTNIEWLKNKCSTLQIQYNLDVVLCQLFIFASDSQQSL